MGGSTRSAGEGPTAHLGGKDRSSLTRMQRPMRVAMLQCATVGVNLTTQVPPLSSTSIWSSTTTFSCRSALLGSRRRSTQAGSSLGSYLFQRVRMFWVVYVPNMLKDLERVDGLALVLVLSSWPCSLPPSRPPVIQHRIWIDQVSHP